MSSALCLLNDVKKKKGTQNITDEDVVQSEATSLIKGHRINNDGKLGIKYSPMVSLSASEQEADIKPTKRTFQII